MCLEQPCRLYVTTWEVIHSAEAMINLSGMPETLLSGL